MEVHIIGAIHHNYCITIYCDSHDTSCPNLGRRVILLGGLDRDIAHCQILYNLGCGPTQAWQVRVLVSGHMLATLARILVIPVSEVPVTTKTDVNIH